MLEKLVESKNDTAENRRLGGFLLTTATGAFFVLTFALVYSLFSYNLALANDNLNLSALITPVQMAEQAPPEQPAEQKLQSGEKTIGKLPSRRDNMMRVDEAPTKAPETVSVVPNGQMARPNSRFLIDGDDVNPSASGVNTGARISGNGSDAAAGISDSLKSAVEETAKMEVAPPPVLKPEPKEAAPPKKTVVSGGVVNGKATDLVKPVYSSAAKAVHAQGKVEVQVTIDEDGRVISANAVSGHPLLIPAAVSAARASKFSSTTLSNQKVKVTGIIVYNFNAQ